jgi:hypothetical protein
VNGGLLGGGLGRGGVGGGLHGGSLGGALATLATGDIFTADGQHVQYLVTFGSPKVGNLEFASWINLVAKPDKNFRVTHYRDMVPHVPMDLQGFEHVGTDIAYNADSSEYQVCAKTCYNYGMSPMDHMTYMGFNWDVARDIEQCNYPDRVVVPNPYRQNYKAYKSILKCKLHATGEGESCKRAGSESEICKCRTVAPGKVVCDTLFQGKCYQTQAPPISEQKCYKVCGGFQYAQDIGSGTFCCTQEKYRGARIEGIEYVQAVTDPAKGLSGAYCQLSADKMRLVAEPIANDGEYSAAEEEDTDEEALIEAAYL